jgi:hypothetical protein
MKWQADCAGHFTIADKQLVFSSLGVMMGRLKNKEIENNGHVSG